MQKQCQRYLKTFKNRHFSSRTANAFRIAAMSEGHSDSAMLEGVIEV
ncbi:MAG: hypothetical protein AB3A66_16865 [Nodularia sp. CChRGM 3473]